MTVFEFTHQFPRSIFEEVPKYKREPFAFVGEDPATGQVLCAEYGTRHPNLVVRYPKDANPLVHWKNYEFVIDSWGKDGSESGRVFFHRNGEFSETHYTAKVRFGKFYGGISGQPPVFEYTEPRYSTHALFEFNATNVTSKFDARTPVVYAGRTPVDMMDWKTQHRLGMSDLAQYRVIDISIICDGYYLVGVEKTSTYNIEFNIEFNWNLAREKAQKCWNSAVMVNTPRVKIIDDNNLPGMIPMSEAIKKLMASEHPVLSSDEWMKEYHRLYCHKGIEQELVIHPAPYDYRGGAVEFYEEPPCQFIGFSTVRSDMIRDTERGPVWHTNNLRKDGLRQMYDGCLEYEHLYQEWLKSIYSSICSMFPEYYEKYHR